MSKGSKTRREDFKKVQDNWSEISWKPKTCSVCGIEIPNGDILKNPELYEISINEKWSVKHKHCI